MSGIWIYQKKTLKNHQMWWVWMSFVCFASDCSAAPAVPAPSWQLRLSSPTSWHSGCRAPALVALCVSLHVAQIVLDWCVVVAATLLSGQAARAESTLRPRRSAQTGTAPFQSAGAIKYQMINFEISGRLIWGQAVPRDPPSGAGCPTGAISERSKNRSPCVSGDFESSLRFAGIVMY